MTGGLDDFQQLFQRFERSAWRWECQPEYHEPAEREPLRRFRAGEQPDDQWFDDYIVMVREATAAGKYIGRVRVLSNPPNEYQRFVMDLAGRCNIPAGEEIRVMWAGQPAQLDLPDHDFWLFDDEVVAQLHLSDHGLTGFDTAPGEVVEQYRHWQRVACENSSPFGEYLAAVS